MIRTSKMIKGLKRLHSGQQFASKSGASSAWPPAGSHGGMHSGALYKAQLALLCLLCARCVRAPHRQGLCPVGAQLRTPGEGRILKLRAYEDNLALYRATIQASKGLPSSYQAMPTTVDYAVSAATLLLAPHDSRCPAFASNSRARPPSS